MEHSERYTLMHTGEVVSSGTGEICVRVDVGSAGRSCAGCALIASCGQDRKSGREDFVVLCAAIPPGMEAPEVGETVSVGLPEGKTLRATLLMLALPLLVFVVLAVLGTITEYPDGIVALSALAGAVLCYFIIYLLFRRRQSFWVLISEKR